MPLLLLFGWTLPNRNVCAFCRALLSPVLLSPPVASGSFGATVSLPLQLLCFAPRRLRADIFELASAVRLFSRHPSCALLFSSLGERGM